MFANSRKQFALIGLAVTVLGAGCRTLPLLMAEGREQTAHEATLAQVVAPPAPLARPAPPIEPVVEILGPPDLWQRLRGGFGLVHHEARESVQAELRWFQRNPRYFQRLTTRMQQQLPELTAAVAARDLPLELALLPLIESALDPYAFSPTGAAGVWQFMPATGRRFGLHSNDWYDGRRDLPRATAAALDYLELLHRRFDDWLLAVAGYNAGEGNVLRALRRARSATGPDASAAAYDFFTLQLPVETRRYVPRLLALAAVVNDPERFGVALPPLVDVPPFARLDTHGQLELAAAAEALGTSVDDLYAWNPSLESWSTPPQGPHQLRVPRDLAEAGQAALDALTPDQRLRWRTVTVKNGDTLSEIAAAHHTEVKVLQQANELRGSSIRIGQTLLIPTTAKPTVAPPHRHLRGSYTVSPGDSLWSIARAHDTTIASLRKANRIGRGEALRVGQLLVIPGHGRSVHRTIYYRVRKGDSLARIAGRFNVSIGDITVWNTIARSDYLQPGQKLKLRVPVVGR